MPLYTRNYNPECPGELINAINADTGIVVDCIQIINNGGSPVQSDFDFISTLTSPQEAAFDALLSTFTCSVDNTNPIDDQNFSDDAGPDPNVIWSSLKITQDFSKRDRVIILHNGSTTQVFQNTFVNVQFDTAVRNDSDYYTYDANDGSITVAETGWYMVMAGVSVEATSTSRNATVAELRIDGGSINGGKSYAYHYADQSSNNLEARGSVYLTAGQTVQVFIARDWGKSTMQTLPDSCRIMLVNMDPIPSGSPAV